MTLEIKYKKLPDGRVRVVDTPVIKSYEELPEYYKNTYPNCYMYEGVIEIWLKSDDLYSLHNNKVFEKDELIHCTNMIKDCIKRYNEVKDMKVDETIYSIDLEKY